MMMKHYGNLPRAVRILLDVVAISADTVPLPMLPDLLQKKVQATQTLVREAVRAGVVHIDMRWHWVQE